MVEETKQSIQQVTQLTITGFDLVAEPSDPNGWITESATDAKADEITESGEGEEAMKLDDILKALRENPELLEVITKQLGLAEQKVIAEALGVSDIKDAKAALDAIGAEGRVLVVLGRDEAVAARSFRNLPNVQVIAVGELNAYDVLVNDCVVFSQATLPTTTSATSEEEAK